MQIALYSETFTGMVAIEEKDGAANALGVIVFEVTESFDGEDIAGFIRWLYVAEVFREQGAATALLEYAFGILASVGINDIICDLPLDEEYNLLCAVLEDFGFEFDFSELYEVMLPIKKIKRLALRLQKQNNPGVHPITAVTSEAFAAFVQEMIENADVSDYLPDIPEAYDELTSCVVFSDTGEISGMLLMGESSDGCPTVQLLRTRDNSAGKLGSLIQYTVLAVAETYPPGTYVRVNCWHQGTIDLLNKLFPDTPTTLVRRGHYHIEKE